MMISCNEYDYIEIACLYHYPVQLTLKTGAVMTGIAHDTQRNSCREECIKLLLDDTEVLVVLDEITKLQVCIENPHFSELVFS